MADAIPQERRLLVIGANHRSSSLMLRDRLFVEERAMEAFLARLRDAGLNQAIVLSTCDRVEVQAAHANPEAIAREILRVMAAHAELGPADLHGQTYLLTGVDAVRHIFAVASSLDSLVIGEPQVFGQVKDSHALSREEGLTGSELEAVLQAAFHTAKRVRTETAVGERPVSIAAAAAQLARDLHGDLDRCSGLLIGIGDMGELVAEDLGKAGLGHLTVTHPIPGRADALARRLACHKDDFEKLPELLATADIVLTSVGARRHVMGADMVAAALQKRRRKPIFLIDTGIPGDIDVAVDRLDAAFLYNLDDLERVAMEGRASREAESRNAWRIVEQEVETFMRSRSERAAVPTLTRLRTFFETVREDALADAGGDADKATRLLINRLLHNPSETLKAVAAEEGAANPDADEEPGRDELSEADRVLKRLFSLDDDGPKER